MASLGDLALNLYENGRFDAVCDALGMVVSCGGEMDLRDLLIFALSAQHLGRTELVEWCMTRAREVLQRHSAMPVALRGLVIEAERLISATSLKPKTSLLNIRIEQGSTP